MADRLGLIRMYLSFLENKAINFSLLGKRTL